MEKNEPRVTVALIDFVMALRSDDLPAAVRHECARGIVNAMGCTLGGSRHALSTILLEGVREFSGPRTTTLLGRGEKADLLTATLVNATSGAAYSFDDTYSEAMLHPCGPVFVALLAIAERKPVSGAQFMAAFAAGVEVACRLTKAIALPPAEGDMAWSQTGIVCGPAVALAAGKLLGLDRAGQHWALGIAASESAGTRATHGSMAASLIFGHAAQTGVRAALLAQKGLTSTPDGIERDSGFAQVFSKRADLSALDGIGTQFELLSNTYKPFPSGVVVHPATEAVLALKHRYGFSAEDVAQIELEVSPAAVRFAFRPDPKDDIEAKVSIHHWAAVASLVGRAGIAEGTMAMVSDPQVRRLRALTRVAANPEFSQSRGQATIVLKTGERLSHKVDEVVGSVRRPMSDDQVNEKCTQQAELAIGAERARRVAATCWAVEGLADVSVLASQAG